MNPEDKKDSPLAIIGISAVVVCAIFVFKGILPKEILMGLGAIFAGKGEDVVTDRYSDDKLQVEADLMIKAGIICILVAVSSIVVFIGFFDFFISKPNEGIAIGVMFIFIVSVTLGGAFLSQGARLESKRGKYQEDGE